MAVAPILRPLHFPSRSWQSQETRPHRPQTSDFRPPLPPATPRSVRSSHLKLVTCHMSLVTSHRLLPLRPKTVADPFCVFYYPSRALSQSNMVVTTNISMA